MRRIDHAHENEICTEALVFPNFPLSSLMITKEKKYETIEKYLMAVSVLSRFASRNYSFYVLSRVAGDPDDVKVVEEVYDYALDYFFTNSGNQFFVEEYELKLPGEDVKRKTSLRSHLFWDLCKLFVTVRRTSLKRRGGDESVVRTNWKELEILRVLSSKKCPKNMSQRELNRAFFVLSAVWKTVDYSKTLSEYVNELVERMCEFFCFTMTSKEMDDDDLRQKIPRGSVPPSSSVKEQYGPNLDYVMMCQVRFFTFLSDLRCYETKKKKSASVVLNDIIKYVSNDREETTTTITNRSFDVIGKRRTEGSFYGTELWFSKALIERFCLESCENVSPEQKESVASRYVYCTFSEADRDWLKYKKPVSLPSFADEFVSKECRELAYDLVVKKTKRSYDTILKEDSKDPSAIGYYEWCVLKNVSRLFALEFDMFSKVVVNREDLKNGGPTFVLSLFEYEKPRIVQFFSRYHVFYENCVYSKYDSNDKFRSETAIYDTLMIWMYIMLRDFPKSRKSKHIEKALKEKYAEFASKDARKNSSSNVDARTSNKNVEDEYFNELHLHHDRDSGNSLYFF